MKQFILYTTSILAILLGTLFIGEYLIRQIPNPYKIKHQQIIQHANEIETIFLGSSHTYFGISPKYIPNSFNLANSSQNFKYDYFILKKYGQLCKRLKTVVLPISYFSFFDKGFENTDNWWCAISYKIYMDCPWHSDFSKYNLELAHRSVYIGKLKSLFNKQQRNTCDNLGWGTNYTLNTKTKTWDTTDAKAAAQRHTAKDWTHIDENLMYFRKIASFCQSHSISLIIITTPTWHCYYELLNQKQLNKMYALIKDLQKEYKFPYYNYLKDSSFIADDFYDSDHLSDVGAKKFTLKLKEEILHKNKSQINR